MGRERRCDNCGKKLEYPNYYGISIEWTLTDPRWGIDTEDSLCFAVCSIKCAVELLRKCLTEGKPLDGDYLQAAKRIDIYAL